MATDELDDEQYYAVNIAVYLLTGIKVDESTCHKWASVGLGGVTIRTRKFGRHVRTKLSWVSVFINRLAGRKRATVTFGAQGIGSELQPVQQAIEAVVGRRVNPATVWRWHSKGVRKVKLRTYLLGKRRLTTFNDVMAFIEASSAVGSAAKSSVVRQALDEELRRS